MSGAWKKYRVRIIAVAVIVIVAWIWIARGSSSTKRRTIPHSYPSAGREFLLHTESGVKRPRPLVLVLADEGMSADQVEKLSKASSYADSHDFAVAYLDGVGEHWYPEATSRDPRFLVDVVRYAATKTRVDLKRVYVWGLAEGGAQALRTACGPMKGVFAAVATIGPIGVTPPSCAKAPNVNHQPGDTWQSTTNRTFWTFSKDRRL
jgi:polyhydroxybutyrate depolymerase